MSAFEFLFARLWGKHACVGVVLQHEQLVMGYMAWCNSKTPCLGYNMRRLLKGIKTFKGYKDRCVAYLLSFKHVFVFYWNNRCVCEITPVRDIDGNVALVFGFLSNLGRHMMLAALESTKQKKHKGPENASVWHVLARATLCTKSVKSAGKIFCHTSVTGYGSGGAKRGRKRALSSVTIYERPLSKWGIV